MQTGKINVQTENIFPIIKKFLYSDHEIFLRELIANAVDATTKLKTLSALDKVKDELGDLTIEVILDKENKTLTVKDRGIGMTAEEIEKYINQIAFSGAEEFVKKFKNKTEVEQGGLIGHFGLGFYSSFMVSDKVEIRTKTYKKGAGSKAVSWECDGSPEYTINEIEKSERGTEIILHINEESNEFLEEHRILELLNKYCKFLPVPIRFGNEKTWEKSETEVDDKGEPKQVEIEKPRIINNSNPLWKQRPADLKDEDYKKFYHELYPMSFEDPLFNIHLNVDYPFEFFNDIIIGPIVILAPEGVNSDGNLCQRLIRTMPHVIEIPNRAEDALPIHLNQPFPILTHGVLQYLGPQNLTAIAPAAHPVQKVGANGNLHSDFAPAFLWIRNILVQNYLLASAKVNLAHIMPHRPAKC